MNRDLLHRLQAGYTIVDHREGGNSMTPIIKSRQPVTIAPANQRLVDVGDVVIARVKGRIWSHLVSAADEKRVQISNNHGHVNGWTGRDKVYGIVTHVEGVERPGALAKVSKIRYDMLDFPCAWEIQARIGTDESTHHPRCSAVPDGGLLCDCGAIETAWAARIVAHTQFAPKDG